MRAIFVGGKNDGRTMDVPGNLHFMKLPISSEGEVEDRYANRPITSVAHIEVYDRIKVSHDGEIAVYSFNGEVKIDEDIVTQQIRVGAIASIPKRAIQHHQQYVFDLTQDLGLALYQEAMKNKEKL